MDAAQRNRSALALAPRRVLMALVRFYRFWFKPWLGSACRFEPTCSAYALQALHHHGAWRGAGLAGWRLMRCHPWCQGGRDPVPGVEPGDLPPPPGGGLFTRWCPADRHDPPGPRQAP